MDPTPGVLLHVRRRYKTIFPPETNFKDFQFHHTLGVIHRLLHSDQEHWQWARLEWQDYEPPGHDHTIVAQALSELAQFKYRGSERPKVPRWILRFALRFLASDTLLPTSVVTDCLSIIAVDLDCDVSNIGDVTLGER